MARGVSEMGSQDKAKEFYDKHNRLMFIILALVFTLEIFFHRAILGQLPIEIVYSLVMFFILMYIICVYIVKCIRKSNDLFNIVFYFSLFLTFLYASFVQIPLTSFVIKYENVNVDNITRFYQWSCDLIIMCLIYWFVKIFVVLYLLAMICGYIRKKYLKTV